MISQDTYFKFLGAITVIGFWFIAIVSTFGYAILWVILVYVVFVLPLALVERKCDDDKE